LVPPDEAIGFDQAEVPLDERVYHSEDNVMWKVGLAKDSATIDTMEVVDTPIEADGQPDDRMTLDVSAHPFVHALYIGYHADKARFLNGTLI